MSFESRDRSPRLRSPPGRTRADASWEAKKIDQVYSERFSLARRQMNADDEAGRRGADGSGKSGLITD